MKVYLIISRSIGNQSPFWRTGPSAAGRAALVLGAGGCHSPPAAGPWMPGCALTRRPLWKNEQKNKSLLKSDMETYLCRGCTQNLPKSTLKKPPKTPALYPRTTCPSTGPLPLLSWHLWQMAASSWGTWRRGPAPPGRTPGTSRGEQLSTFICFRAGAPLWEEAKMSRRLK